MNTSVLQFVQDNIPDDLKNPGLFTGNSGAALLFGELYKYSGKPIYRSKAYDYLQLSLDQLDPMDTSLARGITGVAYTINHLFNHGVLEQSDFLPDLDNLIIESLQVDMDSEMYDYFYGFIGKGLYLFNRQDSDEHIAKLHNYLIQSWPESEQFWRDRFAEKYFQQSNITSGFGLAHGVTSIIYFLTKSLNWTKDANASKHCIFKVIENLKEYKLENCDSLYPDNREELSPTRLAWCRGDLGIALCLYKAGNCLNVSEWIEEAMAVFNFNSKRVLDNSYLQHREAMIESGFCHGTIGLIFIFHQIYSRTNQTPFAESFKYWNQLFIDSFEKSGGLWQYSNENLEWQCNWNLLEGNIGIALALLELEGKTSGIVSKLFLIK